MEVTIFVVMELVSKENAVLTVIALTLLKSVLIIHAPLAPLHLIVLHQVTVVYAVKSIVIIQLAVV
jgi:hypothetical protein